MADVPPHLQPFVVDAPAAPSRLRLDTWDLHLPDTDATSLPVVVLVHGGPLPPDLRPGARDWPVFLGYAGLLAAHGVAAAVVEHPLHAFDGYPTAFDVVRAAVEEARALPQVDGSRVAIWHFSGGAPLVSPWLRDPPPWLRGLALTYPLLDAWAGWSLPEGFRPVEAVAAAPLDLPLLLVRVGRESELLATAVQRFIEAAAAAGRSIDIVDVPTGGHAFDTAEPTAESQQAVNDSVARVLRTLTQ